MTLRGFLFIPFSLLLGLAQEGLPRASAVVEPHARVSPSPVVPGRPFDILVTAKIRQGFHVNANPASQDYLIPTTLEAELPKGFHSIETVYPKGVLRKFKFSATQLSVYEGAVTLRMRVQAPSDASGGPSKLALKLNYQACNEEACLPPVKLSVIAELQLAAGSASKSGSVR